MKKKTTKKNKINKIKKGIDVVGFADSGIPKIGTDKDAPSLMPKFSITLKIGNEVHKGVGMTALEALQSIPKPLKIMNKGSFFMTDGVKKTKEVLMFPVRLRRLFYNTLSQQIQIKSLCMGMK